MRRLVLLAALPLLACRPVAVAPAPPSTIDHARARSELGPGVHRLIEALHTGECDDVRQWMSPRLSAALPAPALANAGSRLRTRFGTALGILEELVHFEAELQWYSGLVLFGDGELLTPVLFQFAVDRAGRLDRLLVREHWFVQNVKNPADGFVAVTRFRLPSNGEWYVMHGGRSRATNYHFGPGAQRFAYDLIVKVEGRQRRPWSRRRDNAAYYAWGRDIVAPGPGTVVYVVNDVPENVPPRRGEKGGNGFVIDHGFGEFSAIWHAIPGSVRVRVGDRVEPGQVLARVGNSGRSTGPHIHFHASHRPDGMGERFGIPAPLHDVWVDGIWYERAMPVRGQYVQPRIERSSSARGPAVFVDL
jgi:murein DD-endopeptidase MepM/ murein hydrolase activator NlpD